MSTLGSRIKELRLERKMTGDELGRVLGISKSTISLYEHDKSTPDDAIKKKICSYFDVSFDWLMGITASRTTIHTKRTGRGVPIPVLGRVVAGVPIDAVQEILDYEEITPEMAATGEYFALQVKGASMEPTLRDGDIVIVKKQPTVDSGDIAIVLVNGNDATVKEIKESPAGITLIGHNVAVYTPHFYSNHDIESLPIQIIGKVVEMRRKF